MIMAPCYSAYLTWTKISFVRLKSAIILFPVGHLFFLAGLPPCPRLSYLASLFGTLAQGSPFLSMHWLSAI